MPPGNEEEEEQLDGNWLMMLIACMHTIQHGCYGHDSARLLDLMRPSRAETSSLLKLHDSTCLLYTDLLS
jgi:hypothetical protein